VVFPIRSQEIPSSASTIGPQLTERNLKRHESSAAYLDTVSDKKRHKGTTPTTPKTPKTDEAWKRDCIGTFSISSPHDRFHAPSTAFRNALVDDDSRIYEDPNDEAIDFDNQAPDPSTTTNEHSSANLKEPPASPALARLLHGSTNDSSIQPKSKTVASAAERPPTAPTRSTQVDDGPLTSEDPYEDAIEFDNQVPGPFPTNKYSSANLKEPSASPMLAQLPHGSTSDSSGKTNIKDNPYPADILPAIPTRFSHRTGRVDHLDNSEDHFFDVQSHQTEEAGQGNRSTFGLLRKAMLFICLVGPCAVVAYSQILAGPRFSLLSKHHSFPSEDDSALPFPDLFYNSATFHAVDLTRYQRNRSSAELDLGLSIEAQLGSDDNVYECKMTTSRMSWNCQVMARRGQLLIGFPKRNETCPLRQPMNKAASCLQSDNVQESNPNCNSQYMAPPTSNSQTNHEVARDRKSLPWFRTRVALFVTAGVLHGTFGSTDIQQAATDRAVWVLDRLFLALTCLTATIQQGPPED
jgi:hypothetical protein